MNNKRSVLSYLLSILLVISYIPFSLYLVFTIPNIPLVIMYILLSGFLVIYTTKQKIWASFILLIIVGFNLNILNVFINFIHKDLEPLHFFLICLEFLPFIAIFLDNFIENAFKVSNRPKSSFYYTDKNYTPNENKSKKAAHNSKHTTNSKDSEHFFGE